MALVPAGVVTVTSTIAAPCAGETAVISVEESTVKLAAVEAKFTALAATKPVPVMTTVVAPVAGPVAGLTELTAGMFS